MLGILFIVSGLLKLYPIEPFELNFIDLRIANWFTAPFIARLLIAFELFLGLLLICNLSLKKITLKATITLLIFFTIYLLFELFTEGNTGNCGCFGTYLQMTPLQSILKNLLLIIIAIILFLYHPNSKARFYRPLILLFLGASVATPFILNPLDLMAAQYRQPESVNFQMDLSLIYNDTIKYKAAVDLAREKHIVAFFSMTCIHCKETAFKMYIMKKRHPEIPFFMVLNGKEDNLKLFFEETKATNIPYMVLLGLPFARITGGSVPIVFWMENGIVVKKSLYISLEEAEILKWLKKEQSM